MRFLRRFTARRELLDLLDEQRAAACLYGQRTGMVQSSPVPSSGGLGFPPLTVSDGSVSEVTRALDVFMDALSVPSCRECEEGDMPVERAESVVVIADALAAPLEEGDAAA